jgi:RNA recognition motif-containing protein
VQVYIEGIPYTATEADVSGFFADCGRVVAVRMPRYQDSGRPRGYAHVVLDSEAAAAKVRACVCVYARVLYCLDGGAASVPGLL